ncbi:hypothetical protein L1987_80042 [Smallanthus sonchifolius]|uniref:Uncharacterized protein n=1 Tax=Smallanthus sonchifolius TaxID=185202 RepID=A0ACB8YM68_9ASTR|nr:hypothetical protein L1987_80042 [Smallanthus sonchifolius]
MISEVDDLKKSARRGRFIQGVGDELRPGSIRQEDEKKTNCKWRQQLIHLRHRITSCTRIMNKTQALLQNLPLLFKGLTYYMVPVTLSMQRNHHLQNKIYLIWGRHQDVGEGNVGIYEKP